MTMSKLSCIIDIVCSCLLFLITYSCVKSREKTAKDLKYCLLLTLETRTVKIFWNAFNIKHTLLAFKHNEINCQKVIFFKTLS